MVLDAEFPIVLRGYERAAVDGYVRRVSRVIAELEASRSPQSAIRYALEQVGEQTRAILQQANDSADEITSKSRAEADERVQRAEREAEAMKVDAERRLVEIEDEIADLWQERQRLLEDMRDVSLRMHDVVVAGSERQPPSPVLPDEDVADDAETHPLEVDRPFLTAVPPPPADAEAEPMLADAPPPLAEEAAGPVAFDDEAPLGAMDEPAAPIAAEEGDPDATQPFDPVPEWEDEAADGPMRLELQTDGEHDLDDDDDPDDDLDTVER